MKKYRAILPVTVFSILLIVGRVIYTGELMFCFLLWNIFLAAIPLYFSHKARASTTNIPRLLFSGVWLLFFPNAMYIITDLFHLQDRAVVPLWYDLLLLFSAALNGLAYGLISLRNIDKTWTPFISGRWRHVLIFLVMILCGYGIYLGRFDRWNSWDIVTQPYYLIRCVAYDLIHPLRSKEVWALSTCFGAWLYLLYRYIQKIKIQ